MERFTKKSRPVRRKRFTPAVPSSELLVVSAMASLINGQRKKVEPFLFWFPTSKTKTNVVGVGGGLRAGAVDEDEAGGSNEETQDKKKKKMMMMMMKEKENRREK